MTRHASAVKRARQDKKRRSRNVHLKSTVKSLSKKVLQAVKEKSPEKAQQALKNAVSAIDKTAGKGAIHHRTASRKISRLTKKVNSISTPPSS